MFVCCILFVITVTRLRRHFLTFDLARAVYMVEVGIDLQIPSDKLYAAVAEWLERPPREREVVGSIPDRVITKTL